MSYSELYVKPLAAGAIFGAALTSAGVYSPSAIIGQMKLRDFLMLKVFISATATSALIIPLATYFGYTHVKPRASSSIGWFSKYDANVIGGSLLGIGMSITGACPGTVLPQIATGVRSSMFVGLGGILGAMLFERHFEKRITEGDRQTLNDSLVNKQSAILGYEAVCASIVAGAVLLFPADKKSLVSPILGGLLVGLSQAANLLLTGNALGVSGAYASTSHLLTSSLRSLFRSEPKTHEPKRDYRSVFFIMGAVLGSCALSRAASLPLAPDIGISAIKATIGGVVLVFGARVGGGCTSGHGITGMSQLSIASFVTVAAMFGGGIGWIWIFG